MAPHAGLLWTSIVFLVAAGLFYLLSVAGGFWPRPSPANDLGVYAVTVMLLGFGVGTLLLRWAKLHPEPPA